MTKIIRSSSILVLYVLILTIFGCAQITGYSESTTYSPRKDPYPTTGKKGKTINESSGPTVPMAAVSTSKTVTIPFSVVDKAGNIVSDLKPSDFLIYVNDKAIDDLAFASSPRPLSVVLLIDASPSGMQIIEDTKKYASSLVKALPADTLVAVVQFSSTMKVLSDLTRDRDESLKSLKKIEVGDGTSLYSAIGTFYQQIVPNLPPSPVLFLLTDGVDSTSKKFSYTDSLVEAEKRDVTVLPFYLNTENLGNRIGGSSLPLQIILPALRKSSNGVSFDESYRIGRLYLSDLAALSGGTMSKAEKAPDLSSSIAKQLTGRYFVSFKVPADSSNGRLELKVRVNRPNLIVRARGSLLN